jgi:hypothetical protein
MNVETISSMKPPPDSKAAVEPVERPVINLDEIKSMIEPGGAESHRVDTFA